MAPRKSEAPVRKVLVVTYDDGRTERVHPNRPALIVAMSREFGVNEPTNPEHVYWLCWHGLGRPSGDLDTWLDQVEDISPDDAPGKA